MAGEQEKTACGIGLLAHVDAGKTTLSEAILYTAGVRRTMGRVDHQDAFLDTHALERQRGITIFSKQALFETPHLSVTLVDTPGHVDFGAETERTLPILDCAVLVISGTDGVQAHTRTLWQLLARYNVPTVLFINKMDLPGCDREKIMAQLQDLLDPGCVDMGLPREQILEQAALCDEALLETYLETGTVTEGNLRGLVSGRRLFPCVFGSALKLDGVSDLLEILDTYAPRPRWSPDFSARVSKITRDPQGNRLTWLKITGGSLSVRQILPYTDKTGRKLEEKITALRLYAGERFTQLENARGGQLVAAVGLSATYAGQSLGAGSDAPPPVLEPVMTYRVSSPLDPARLLPLLRQLEEEDPQLHVLWDEASKGIHVQLMGRVQLEILRSVMAERFHVDIDLTDPRIFYKETIAAPVEGVGHYEPLRHYAEVHLLLEPLPRGSGLVFGSLCPTDVLDAAYQNLVLTHLQEKMHIGVKLGAPITDMKISLLVGRAHLKHTEGGDFRQATYRAVRQGLMQAETVILEPMYAFQLTLPAEQVGRAITDLRAMHGQFDPPETLGELAALTGTVPAATFGDYAAVLAAYTQGRGQIQLTFHGYDVCHDPEAVIAQTGYDPERDLDNTPDSVFCAHGAGFTVKWQDVPNYMHLDSGLKQERSPRLLPRNIQVDDRQLEAIMEREFGPIRRKQYGSAPRQEAPPEPEPVTIRPPRDQWLIVDGYNVLFAWEELEKIAQHDLDAARRKLMDILASYAAFRKIHLILVFDGYKMAGNPGEKLDFSNITVVYTKEGETGDQYIEALTAQIGSNDAVTVATSDALVQLSSFRSGVLRMSARELWAEVERCRLDMKKFIK